MIRVSTSFHPTDKTWSAPLETEKFKNAMWERGIHWGADEGELQIVDKAAFPESPIDQPTIIYDRVDQACCSDLVRELGQQAAVKAILKPVSYVELKEHNADYADERRVGAIVRMALGPTNGITPRPQMTQEVFGKIHVITTLGHQHIDMWPWLESAPVKKDIDVSFIGCTYYSGILYPERHRKVLCECMQKLPNKWNVVCMSNTYHGVQMLNAKLFHEIMQRSRVVISPFGIGEFTFRDYQALFARCAVVKPVCGAMAIDWMPFTYATFTDGHWMSLEAAIDQALRKLPVAQEYAERTTASFQDHNLLADKMESIIKECV